MQATAMPMEVHSGMHMQLDRKAQVRRRIAPSLSNQRLLRLRLPNSFLAFGFSRDTIFQHQRALRFSYCNFHLHLTTSISDLHLWRSRTSRIPSQTTND